MKKLPVPLAGLLFLIPVSCMNILDRAVIFPGNGNNSDFDFRTFSIPEESRSLESIPFPEGKSFGLRVSGKPGINDLLKNRVVLFFHGNGGRIDQGTSKELAEMFYEAGINFFAMEYRGYGASANFITTEQSTYEDARTAYAYLKSSLGGNYADGNIIIMGHSLGSAVALDLAVKEKESTVITLSAFTSLTQAAEDFTGYEFDSGWVSEAAYDNLQKVAHIDSRILLFHGEKDLMAKWTNSKVLFETAGNPKELVLVPEAGHDDIITKLDPTYIQKIIEAVGQ